jgi:two-component system, NarL family, sensor kinase
VPRREEKQMKPGKPDWDALLSHGLIWSLLFGYLTILYVVIILICSLLLQRPVTDYDPPWWMNLIALLVSLPTFLPVYRWLRAGVRELIFSQQEHPYPALERLNQHLEAAPSPQLLLPNIAETIARALKLPYLEIETSQSGPGLIRYGSPVKGATVERVPMNYLGTRMGEMLVSARSPYESLSPADLSVLHDLAQHVGSALYTARLTEDLQRARERLVITREEERRRIRNDLHDGLAPTLSALQIQLGAIRSLMREHPDQAEAIITEMREDLRGATAEIRQLVYDLRPPRLDDLGLVGALKNTRSQH